MVDKQKSNYIIGKLLFSKSEKHGFSEHLAQDYARHCEGQVRVFPYLAGLYNLIEETTCATQLVSNIK